MREPWQNRYRSKKRVSIQRSTHKFIGSRPLRSRKKSGFGAIEDLVTQPNIAEAMLSSLIAATTKQLRSIFLQQESPDRYAAAVCIAIRSDCYADILKAEAATCPRCEGAAGLLQTLSGCHDVFVERLLLFLLGCFLCLLRLLRFLGHVALRDPQNWINASHLACIQNTPQLQN